MAYSSWVWGRENMTFKEHVEEVLKDEIDKMIEHRAIFWKLNYAL